MEINNYHFGFFDLGQMSFFHGVSSKQNGIYRIDSRNVVEVVVYCMLDVDLLSTTHHHHLRDNLCSLVLQ